MVQFTGTYFAEHDVYRKTEQFDSALLHTGLVLYEVIRVVDHVALFLEDHLSRFRTSIALSGRSYTVDHAHMRDVLAGLMERNGLSYGNINLTLHFPPDGQPGLYAFCIPHAYPAASLYATGADTDLFSAFRSDPNIKRVLPDVREKAIRMMTERNLYEVLLVRDNEITEGSRSNVFFVSGDTLLTPPGDRVLKGITRRKVMDLCNKLNIKLIERSVLTDTLSAMDAAFLTGTSPKVLPIRKIGAVTYAAHHPVTAACMKAYDILIRDEVRQHRRSFC